MPTLLKPTWETAAPLVPPRKRWTREDCAPLDASGLFEREKLELVEGELISKMGKNRPHVIAFTLMHLWLLKVFGAEFVNAEAPIDVSPADNPTSEPVPDLIVLRRGFETITSGNPQPEEVGLVVEISDSTLNYDLKVKAPLYARAGITEYWVLDIGGRRLISHRNPTLGKYTSVIEYGEREAIAPLAAPNASFHPALALPKL